MKTEPARSRTNISALPIVVGIDRGGIAESSVALEAAVREAERSGVRIRLVHGLGLSGEPSDGYGVRGSARVASAQRAVRQATRYLRHLSEVPVEVVGRVAPQHPGALLLAEAERASLVITQRRAISGLNRMVQGSTSALLAAQSPCPVMVVRADHELGGAHDGVLVGVDGRGHAQEAVAAAFERAELDRRPLTAVYAWFDALPAAPGYGFVPPSPEEQAESDQQAHRTLAEAIAGARSEHPDVAVTCLVVRAPVVEALVAQSRQHAMVFVGRHGQPGAASHGLGGVARSLMAHSECPVVVTPTARPRRR